VADISKAIACWLLCALELVFPFSVAATNILLGVSLALGMVSGIWWAGARHMWTQYRGLSVAMLAYWGLMIVGLSWSADRMWGLHVLGRQWFWLAVPLVLAVLDEARWRLRFLMALSLGLTLHLIFCVLQKVGYVTLVDFGGSNADDATGYIGHISFGFIYGIWAGWLLHWGWKQHGWKRWTSWLLASWAWIMIFAAQGRTGYLAALAIMVVVLGKHWFAAGWRKALLPVGLLVVMAGVLAVGPGKERLLITWHDITAIKHGDIRDSDPRWSLWIAAVQVWKDHPVLGVGTGGFPAAMMAVKKSQPDLYYGGNEGVAPAHPHNMYVFSLARWGLPGLGAFLALLTVWISTGWRLVWDRPESPLMVLSGVALAMDACFAPTMEQHGTGVMLVLMLGLELASGKRLRSSVPGIALNREF
jgi:O-antigen ligase